MRSMFLYFIIYLSCLSILVQAVVVQDATRFKPIFRFDGKSESFCYPDYPTTGNNNKCHSSLSSSSPAFVQSTICGSYKVYSFFLWYGKQKGCIIFDKGHGNDWEGVSVFVKSGRVQKVKYYQHNGFYTRRRGKFERIGERPVVYVGKVAHGSYHAKCTGKCSVKLFFTKGCLGSVNYCQGGCGYWDDFRNPGPEMNNYRLLDLQPGKIIYGIRRPNRSPCGAYCKGLNARLLTLSGCWQNEL